MPSLSEHSSISVVRLLNLGESGSGKTGSLASLAQAGYNLHILDFDNGLDILANILRDSPAAVSRVAFETLKDEIILSKGVPKIKSPPTAFKRAGEVLESWHAETFGPTDIIVLDTLMSFSAAAFNYWLFLGGRLNQHAQMTDYGNMADSVLTFIDMLTTLPCNVVVNSHVRYIGGDEETGVGARGLPNAKGQQIPKDVGKAFNTTVLTRSQGSGPATRRLISTTPQGVIEVKTSNPKGVKPAYPLDTGMADLFKDILGHGPTPLQPSAASSLVNP